MSRASRPNWEGWLSSGRPPLSRGGRGSRTARGLRPNAAPRRMPRFWPSSRVATPSSNLSNLRRSAHGMSARPVRHPLGHSSLTCCRGRREDLTLHAGTSQKAAARSGALPTRTVPLLLGTMMLLPWSSSRVGAFDKSLRLHCINYSTVKLPRP